ALTDASAASGPLPAAAPPAAPAEAPAILPDGAKA
ncbi:MAG: hypothetical protein K0S42_2203, partial [Microvirga sp.]|nr:hypothetical protein [Microvirga sp.]